MNLRFELLRAVTRCAVALIALPAIADENRGFYAGAEVGGTVAESASLKEFPDVPPGGEVKFHPGARLSLNGGYRFNQWLSLGLETGFMANAVKDSDISVSQVPLLANVEFSVPNQSPIEPFVGGGPGFSASSIYVDDDRLGTGSDVDGGAAEVVFAWQAYGGVRYKVSDSVSVGLVYKYFAADETEWDVRGTSQDIRFGRARIHSFSASVQVKF